jgi:hypothetical protein
VKCKDRFALRQFPILRICHSISLSAIFLPFMTDFEVNHNFDLCSSFGFILFLHFFNNNIININISHAKNITSFLFILLFIWRFYRHSYHGLNIFKSDTNSVNIFTTVLRIGMIRLWYGGNINSNIKQLKKKLKFIYAHCTVFSNNKYGSYFFTITIFYTFLYLFFTVICILSKLDLVLSKLNFPKILDLIFVLLKFCVYIDWNYFGMCN